MIIPGVKDIAPIIATGNDVIKSARDLYSRLSCHGRGLYQRASESQKRMSDPAPPYQNRLENGRIGGDGLALAFFHELLHGAGRIRSFDHNQVGEAIYKAASDMNIELTNKPHVADPEKLKRDDYVADNERGAVEGSYFHIIDEALKKGCGKTTAEESKK